jgi:hypothetical protein
MAEGRSEGALPEHPAGSRIRVDDPVGASGGASGSTSRMGRTLGRMQGGAA